MFGTDALHIPKPSECKPVALQSAYSETLGVKHHIFGAELREQLTVKRVEALFV